MHAVAARIGPNAIIRVAEALDADRGRAVTARVFARAGLDGYLDAPPSGMVDEREVATLHARLRETLGVADARRIGHAAGVATADYLLAHRIPRPVQALLKRLPAGLAARILLAAIGRHAWTFAGSGRFAVVGWKPLTLAIAGNPLCRGVQSDQPLCDYYAATFERLFRVLVHPRTVVRETACEAMGAPACTFELRWRG
jgi:divinyl protochlorophyllide a 8-vinyl-reductase